MTTRCATPIAFESLLSYLLDELPERVALDLEEHFLGCGPCSDHLQEVADLADEIRLCARTGGVHAIVSDGFVKRLNDGGVHLREYRVPRGGSVPCTIGPDDDLVIARLEGSFEGADQIDLIEESNGVSHGRLRDIPFDPASGGILLASRSDLVRSLPSTTIRFQVVAVKDGADRVLGEYTLEHSPWPAP